MVPFLIFLGILSVALFLFSMTIIEDDSVAVLGVFIFAVAAIASFVGAMSLEQSHHKATFNKACYAVGGHPLNTSDADICLAKGSTDIHIVVH